MSYNMEDKYDMKKILASPEWNVYMKFLTERSIQLKEKVLVYVRGANLLEAQKALAVVDDIQKQVDLFKQTRIDLENKPLKEE